MVTLEADKLKRQWFEVYHTSQFEWKQAQIILTLIL